MRRSSRRVCAPCCFVFAAVGCALGIARPLDAADFNDLLRRVPPGANAMMLIDANAVMKSPIAVRNGWKSKQEAAYVKKPFLLPPEADRVVIAAQLRPNDGFRMNWQLATMSLNTARFDGWKGIEDSIPAIRQKMTKKFGVEF
jgi:hypothetical protein